MFHFLARFFASHASVVSQNRARSAKEPRRFRPGFDCLEARTVPTATLVRDLRPGLEGSSPSELVRFHNRIFFVADDGIRGRELWQTDGTTTVLVKDIFPGPTSADPQHLTVSGNFLYFSADDGLRGRELWKTDGTTDGTILVRDINVGPKGSNPTELIEFFDRGFAPGRTPRLYFSADDGLRGRELWRSGGTAFSTILVRDINAGPEGSSPTYLTVVNRRPLFEGFPHSELYFQADDGIVGAELWRTRGRTRLAPITTELVNDIRPGAKGSSPFNLTAVGPVLYFGADDGSTGKELWRNDRFNAAFRVRDINPGPADSLEESRTTLFTRAAVGATATNKNRLVFAADNGSLGRELWISNGTLAGTVLVRDINPGLPSSNPSMQRHPLPERRSLRLPAPGGAEVLLFSANDGTFGRELWRTNGDFAGTNRVRDINLGLPDGIVQDELIGIVSGNQAFFAANNGDTLNGNELWISNGSTLGTHLLEDVNPGTADSNPTDFEKLRVGGVPMVFFAADNAFVGREPWRVPG